MDTTNIYFALHVISFVAWIAGLLYLGRILVYHSDAYSKDKNERDILIRQYLIMEKRVNGYIAFPAMILTLIMGTLLMSATKAYFQTWFHIKLLLIILLIFFHMYYGVIFIKFKKNKSDHPPYSVGKLKIYNELVTLFLIFIVFTASLKDPKIIFKAWGVSLAVFIGFFLLVRILKKSRITLEKLMTNSHLF